MDPRLEQVPLILKTKISDRYQLGNLNLWWSEFLAKLGTTNELVLQKLDEIDRGI